MCTHAPGYMCFNLPEHLHVTSCEHSCIFHFCISVCTCVTVKPLATATRANNESRTCDGGADDRTMAKQQLEKGLIRKDYGVCPSLLADSCRS